MGRIRDLEALFHGLWASILEAARSHGVRLKKEKDGRRFMAAPADPEALDFFFPHFLCVHDPERKVLRFGALLPEPLGGIPQAVFWSVFKRSRRLPLRPLPLEALGMDPSPGDLALVVEITPAHLRGRSLADEDVDALVAEVALETMGAGLLVKSMREEGFAPNLRA